MWWEQGEWAQNTWSIWVPLIFSCNCNCEWTHPATMIQKGWLSWVQDPQKWRFESPHQVTSKTSRDDIRGWEKFRIGSEGVLVSFASGLSGQPLSSVWLFVAPSWFLSLYIVTTGTQSVHGISQARILEQVTISYSRVSSRPRDQTHISCVSCISRKILYH